MAGTNLPAAERVICSRLRLAREQLGLTQAEAANQLKITRERLLTYEYLRAPLRCDLALRFCRQFVVSEEWLATGMCSSMERSAVAHGFDPGIDWSVLGGIFFRQSMDLLAEPIVHSVPPNSLFSVAWERYLHPRYAELAMEFPYTPRIILSENPEPQVAFNLLAVLTHRWLQMLANEALRFEVDGWLVQRNFVRGIVETNAFLFRQLIAAELDILAFQQLVRHVVSEAPTRDVSTRAKAAQSGAPDAVLPGTETRPASQREIVVAYSATPLDIELMAEASEIGSWSQLRELLRESTTGAGAKAAFARDFGVSIQVLSQWLSNTSAPKADDALRLRRFLIQRSSKPNRPLAVAEGQRSKVELDKKGAGSASTRPALKTRKDKSSHEKAKSDQTKS